MEKSILDKNKSVIESRMSFYMLQEEKQKQLSKNTLVHRMITVCKKSRSVRDDKEFENYFESIFDRLQRKDHAEISTGNLLIYPDHVIIILESSIEVVTEVIRSIRSEAMTGETELFTHTKVVNVDHDVEPRLFKGWKYRYLNVPRHVGEAPIGVEQEEIATEIISAILQIAFLLLKQPRLASAEEFEDACSELLPPSGNLEAMMVSDSLMSADQYLELYARPIDYVLDAEKLWPIDQDVRLTTAGVQQH